MLLTFRPSNTAAMLAVTLCWSACAHPSRATRTYFGTVTQIVQPAGDYYSTTSGPRPLTRIRIRLESGPSMRPGTVEIVLHELYSARVHGSIGDRVVFHTINTALRSAELSFRTLVDYRIIDRDG